jgi:hypothetical protein
MAAIPPTTTPAINPDFEEEVLLCSASVVLELEELEELEGAVTATTVTSVDTIPDGSTKYEHRIYSKSIVDNLTSYYAGNRLERSCWRIARVRVSSCGNNYIWS